MCRIKKDQLSKSPHTSIKIDTFTTTPQGELHQMVDLMHEVPDSMWKKRGQEMLAWFDKHTDCIDIEEYLDAVDLNLDTFEWRKRTSPIFKAYCVRVLNKIGIRRRKLTERFKYPLALYENYQIYYSELHRLVTEANREIKVETARRIKENEIKALTAATAQQGGEQVFITERNINSPEYAELLALRKFKETYERERSDRDNTQQIQTETVPG